MLRGEVVLVYRCLAALAVIAALLLAQPSLQAATESTDSPIPGPTATVVLAQAAHVGSANAVGGTTVYPGDSLDTAPGGGLRLVVGSGQVYLLSDSAVNLLRSGSVLQAALIRGTVGFSSLTNQEFQIVTPEGIVEAANGVRTFGQVTFADSKDIVISDYTGELVLHRGTQTLSVKPGQSYYVSLVPDDPYPPQRGSNAYNYHLVWRLIVVGAAAGVGYWLWQLFSSSPVTP